MSINVIAIQSVTFGGIKIQQKKKKIVQSLSNHQTLVFLKIFFFYIHPLAYFHNKTFGSSAR